MFNNIDLKCTGPTARIRFYPSPFYRCQMHFMMWLSQNIWLMTITTPSRKFPHKNYASLIMQSTQLWLLLNRLVSLHFYSFMSIHPHFPFPHLFPDTLLDNFWYAVHPDVGTIFLNPTALFLISNLYFLVPCLSLRCHSVWNGPSSTYIYISMWSFSPPFLRLNPQIT